MMDFCDFMSFMIVIPSGVPPTPFHTRFNCDGNTCPKRAQRKAKLNKMESEIDQTGSQMRAKISLKCARGGCLESFEETGRE